MHTLCFVGPGRAGRSFAIALERAGRSAAGPPGRDDDCSDAATGVDLLLIAVSDAAIRLVAVG